MGSLVRLAAATPTAFALMTAFSLAACDTAPTADPRSPAPDPGRPTEVMVDVETGPLQGTCWDVPPADAVDPDYWHDDSPRVPCNEPHTTQTVHVFSLHEPTAAAAMERSDSCFHYVRSFLGADIETWVPWLAVMYLPSEEQIANGASWARCDAAFPSRWDFRYPRPRTTTGSAVLVADDPPLQLWACLDQHPTMRDQPLVPCDQPHAYEQTGQQAHLDEVKAYPPPARLAAETRSQCAASVPDEYDGNVELSAGWDPPERFQRGTDIYGACFISLKSGEPLPPRD